MSRLVKITKTNPIQIGQLVTFVFNDHNLTYELKHSVGYFLNNLYGLNSQIFKDLGIEDRDKFCEKATGVTIKKGYDFPEVDSLYDLYKILRYIEVNYCCGKEEDRVAVITENTKSEDKELKITVRKRKEPN